MTTIRSLAAAAALALLSTGAMASDGAGAPSDAAARTVAAIHYVRLATDALHPRGDYKGLSSAEVGNLLDIDALRGRVNLTMTEHGWVPADGWGNAILIEPVVGRHGRARRYTVTLPGIDGADCKELVGALTCGVRMEFSGRPIRRGRVPGVVCRRVDHEGQIDVVLTLP